MTYEEPIDDIEELMFDRGLFTRPDWDDESLPRGEQTTRFCPTQTPEPHQAGEFPMTCYQCHLVADS